MHSPASPTPCSVARACALRPCVWVAPPPAARSAGSSCARRPRVRVLPPNSDAFGDAEPAATLGGLDWREFRAKLVAQQRAGEPGGPGGRASPTVGRLSDENLRLLQLQNPKLAAEAVWAHPTAQPERGGLLLATPDAPLILNSDTYWQAVVLLVQHSVLGSVGLLLNRPSSLVLGQGKGGLPFPIIGAPEGMQTVFASNRVYCGGLVRQDVFHLVHGHNLAGSMEVVPGVFVGGESAAVKAVKSGLLPPEDFKFYSGACVWADNELQREVDKGAWLPAAASRPLILKQCLQLPKPLWREVVEVSGSEAAMNWRLD